MLKISTKSRNALSVIIPASNEAGYIGACLTALLASGPIGAEVIVVANGCRDNTAAVAAGFADRAIAAGWRLTVIELPDGSKPRALNAGDAAANGTMLAYLDADVQVSPALMAQLITALQPETPTYATGTARIPRAKSGVTRAYARFWQRLPFAKSNAPGYGLFAVNAAGRALWGEFPAIISDDTFVRLQFTPDQRIQTTAPYDWPMIEGFAALTRVRRRQNAGVVEIAKAFPDLLRREAKPRPGKANLFAMALGDPVAFAVYAAVTLAVRLRRGDGWTRGR